MLILLPLVAFVLLFLISLEFEYDFRQSFLCAAVLWGVLVAGSTEALSAVSALTRTAIALSWMAASAVAWVYLRGVSRKFSAEWKSSLAARWIGGSKSLPAGASGLLSGCAVITAGVGFIALVSPPNTPDAMLYHITRVVYWLQHHNTSLYPTIYPPQAFMPPWAEYAMAQLYALGDGDRFVNLVQWFSFVGCGIGVSLIARSLGACGLGQVFAATVAMTIPQGLMQASGAKNDYVLAFWMVCCAYFMMSFKQRSPRATAVLAALSCGLALMTKSTAYVLLSPIIAVVWLLWPRKTRMAFAGQLPVFAVLVLALNGPQLARTFSYCGSPFGCESADGHGVWKFANEHITLSGTVSNLVRNTALHLATPSADANAAVQRWSEKLLSAFAIVPNDPATTFNGTTFQILPPRMDEDATGNVLHLLVIAAAIIWFTISKEVRKRETLAFAVSLAVGYVLFCAYLRWQPWHTRLHLPLFVLWSAVIGAVLGNTWGTRGVALCGTVLLVFASPALLQNERRSLISANNIFNSTRQQLQSTPPGHYLAAKLADGMSCKSVGIDSNYGFIEYPLLSVLRAGRAGRRVEQVSVANKSLMYSDPAFKPGCIICVGCLAGSSKWNQYESAGMTGALLQEVSFFYPTSTRFPNELQGFVPPPGPHVHGASGDWITPDGINIVVPGDMLLSQPNIEAIGHTILSEYLGKDLAGHAELRVPGRPPKEAAVQLELPYQPNSLVNYRILIRTDPTEILDNRDVTVHLSFNKHFVPQEIGFAPDLRKLVIMAPKQIRLMR